MKIAVYGTLKKGYGNNRLLADATFIEEKIIKGYKLYYSGGVSSFPVAAHSPDDKMSAEIFDIGETPNSILRNMDWLEGNGFMYHRTIIDMGDDVQMYVGHDDYWQFDQATEVKPTDGIYKWNR